MIEKPQNVRIVGAGDERKLYNFIEAGHKESAIFPMSPTKLNNLIDVAINRSRPVIIGVIDSPVADEFAASICIVYEQPWYSDEWALNELWNNVRPNYRRSNYAKDLLGFGKWAAEAMGKVLQIGVITTERMEAKIRLYRRQELQQTGAYFIYNIGLAHGPAAREIM